MCVSATTLQAVAIQFILVLLFSPVVAESAPIRFAVVGDYGVDDANELAVANLIKSTLRPGFVLTLGDNCYYSGNDFDRTVGKYYSQFIGNYQGAYGSGRPTNRFWPASGNHDYFDLEGYAPYLNYFTLPGNERYYDYRAGPVHLFILNNDRNEPDGVTSTSPQARWLSNQLARSTAPWKLIALHHPPYSSSSPDAESRWPFRAWGAHAVLSAHAHNYERFFQNGLTYFVNGVGGASFHPIVTPSAGSQFHDDDTFGAMLIRADDAEIVFEFYSATTANVLDRHTLRYEPRLAITRGPSNSVQLAWPTNRTSAFQLQTRVLPGNWTAVPNTLIIPGTNYTVSVTASNRAQRFRLRKP